MLSVNAIPMARTSHHYGSNVSQQVVEVLAQNWLKDQKRPSD